MAKAYLYSLTDTWDNAATTFNAIRMSVTDTASAAASLLMDLQVGGSSLFSVRKDGLTTTRNIFPVTDNTYTLGSSSFYWGGVFASNVTLKDAGALGWQSADLFLRRDAANTLAQRNGVNAQTFRVYNTYTDASNYERLAFLVSGGSFIIQTERAGTGTARALYFGANGTQSWFINTSNHFLAGADNTYDIGASGASRPRNLYMASWIRMATTTVAALPAAATAGAGARMFVTDALAPVFGSAVAGGGAVTVPVYSTGTAWNVG